MGCLIKGYEKARKEGFMKRFCAIVLAMVLFVGMQMQVFAVSNKDIETFSARGVGSGSQSGWSGEFSVYLDEGGNNGSVVFRIYGNSDRDVYFWVKDPNGNKVTPYKYEISTALQPNDGEEQTIYFKNGYTAPKGTYTVGWTAYGTTSTTVNAKILYRYTK